MSKTCRSDAQERNLSRPHALRGLILFSLLTLAAPVTHAQRVVIKGDTVQEIEILPNIHFRTDRRVFTVMAALNAAGFDYEAPSREMSAVRKGVRSRLAALDADLRSRMNRFYLEHPFPDVTSTQAAYISLALLLTEPPELRLIVDPKTTPAEVTRIAGFEKLVQEFYLAANVESLWEQFRAHYELELERYLQVMKAISQETLAYFRIPARIAMDRQIFFISDLLNSHDIVNARNLDRVYYVVVGPSETNQEYHLQLQHEYLHFLLDPIVEKFAAAILQHQELLNVAQRQPAIKSEYQNQFLRIVTESLIEGILLRLHPTPDFDARMVRSFHQGLVLTPYFYRGVKNYDSDHTVTFPAYCETLFQKMASLKIEDDENEISAMYVGLRQTGERRSQEEAKSAAADAIQKQVNGLLSESAKLLAQKNLEPAQSKLWQVLELDPGNRGAFFYLAQIAGQGKNTEEAFTYYGKAAQNPSPPWIRAWSLLRMGSILASRGEFKEARSYFLQVTSLSGDLRGAREAAEKAIKEMPE
ncbi:MAG: hypothetical protein HY645_14405 [Acidobacteria bacterium]|nr:hypothetical protein [Acidobacteriota bacterium]